MRNLRGIHLIAGVVMTAPLSGFAQSGVMVGGGANPRAGLAPLTVSFSVKGFPASAPNSSPATFSWNFGDNEVASGEKVLHKYLRPGTYRATVIYTRFINRIDPPELRETATNSFLITVTSAPPVVILPPARLQVSPPELTFNAQEGSTNPRSQFLSISNSGGMPLQWTLSNDAAWLRISVNNGDLAARQGTQIAANVVITDLASGARRAQISISSKEATNGPIMAGAILVLSPKPGLPWLKPAAIAGAGLLALAGTISLVRKGSRERGKKRAEVRVQVIADPGKQEVKTNKQLVRPTIKTTIRLGEGVTEVRVKDKLIRSVHRKEG